MSETTGPPEPRPLRGWKEIATHLGTSVRSAQRYASELDLPVHRRGTKGAPVVAFPAELDDWLRRQSPAVLDRPDDRPGGDEEPQPEDSKHGWARWRRPLYVLLVVGVLGAIGALATWRTPASGQNAAVPAASERVTLGVRVGEAQNHSLITTAPHALPTLSFKSGLKLWIETTVDGDRLRLTLFDLPEGAPNRSPVAKASLTRSQVNDLRPVTFVFDHDTIHLWWAPPGATSPGN